MNPELFKVYDNHETMFCERDGDYLTFAFVRDDQVFYIEVCPRTAKAMSRWLAMGPASETQRKTEG
jgi:hypothetical protein